MFDSMKKITGIFILFCIWCAGCKQDEPQPKSVSDILIEDSELGMLRAAIDHAGIRDAFKTSTVTIYAPSDEGFKAAGFADASAITALPPEEVRALLTNHIMIGKITKEKMALGLNNPVTMMSKGNAFLSNVNGGPFLNHARFTKTDMVATNGVVHVINNVVPIANRSVGLILKNTPDYSLFREALLRARIADPRLQELVDTTAKTVYSPSYTLFLPTNQAMTAARLSSAEISVTSPIILARTVGYHIALSRYFSYMLSGNLAMLDASYVTSFDVQSTGIKIKDRQNPPTEANLIKTNINATNGIIHVIDKVLKP